MGRRGGRVAAGFARAVLGRRTRGALALACALPIVLAACASRQVVLAGAPAGEPAEVSDTMPLFGDAASLASVDGVEASRGFLGSWSVKVPAGRRRLGAKVTVDTGFELRTCERTVSADLEPGAHYELRAVSSEHEPPDCVQVVRVPGDVVVATSEPTAADLVCAEGHLDGRGWKVIAWRATPGFAIESWVPTQDDPVAATIQVSAWAGLPPLGPTDEDVVLDQFHKDVKDAFDDVQWAIVAREERTSRSLVASWSGTHDGRAHEGLVVARIVDGRAYRLSVIRSGGEFTAAERQEWQQRFLAARVFPPARP